MIVTLVHIEGNDPALKMVVNPAAANMEGRELALRMAVVPVQVLCLKEGTVLMVVKLKAP